MTLKPALPPGLARTLCGGAVMTGTWTTERVPALTSALVFQVRLVVRVGSTRVLKPPLTLPLVNNWTLSPSVKALVPMLVTVNVPPRVKAPPTKSRSPISVPLFLLSLNSAFDPILRVRLLVIVKVPMTGPAAELSPTVILPPDDTVVAPSTVPLPDKVAPLATVTLLVPSTPSTCNVPALTVVVPALLAELLTCRMPAPPLVMAALLPVMAPPVSCKSTGPVPRATVKVMFPWRESEGALMTEAVAAALTVQVMLPTGSKVWPETPLMVPAVMVMALK